MWRSLLRLERWLQKSLLWLAGIVPVWLAALFLSCAGSIGVVVLMGHPQSRSDWSEFREIGAILGLGPGVIVAICLTFAPTRFAGRILIVGSVIAWVFAAWCTNRLIQALIAS